jgi:hypothetical protein
VAEIAPIFIMYFTVLQDDIMQLQGSLLSFAAVSVEESSLLACIQGGVAAEDNDDLATEVNRCIPPSETQGLVSRLRSGRYKLP